MWGGIEYAARIKCTGRDGPARDVQALCGTDLNGRPTCIVIPSFRGFLGVLGY